MTEERLLDEVRGIPVSERAVFLDRACAGQPELRARIEAMLAADMATCASRDHAAALWEPTDVSAIEPDKYAQTSPPQKVPEPYSDHQAGTVIADKYTLVDVIGEGGMGSVWRARQTEPVKRFVAIKLIKAGMDSKQVLARFEAERQALSLMDHPNIAKVLDAGLHEHRPFFVMELVKGLPITEFCDARKLTPKERLELFVQACQAIQHAHQKGIIHRDIKPSNVLVALYDDRPVVKVIDFGVAKATGGSLTEATIDTAFGGVVGTPQYMSPEQATFNNLDVDTRSDVYALGVLLYELLTGSPPFSGEELKKKGYLEILRVVREDDPPRPSTKLSTAAALPSLSANRATEPKKLTGLLRNELDWIVMKALEKDRTRRYETANGFAADVMRFLAGEPILAHPPSVTYQFRKFARQNRPQVIAGTLVLLALIAGVIGMTAGLLEARKQAGIARQEAAEKEASRAEEARHRLLAQRNEEKAIIAAEQEQHARTQIASQLKQIELINETVFDIFGGFDVREIREGSEPIEAVLAKRLIDTGKTLDDKTISDPLVLAKLRNRLGLTLISLGYPNEAIELFQAARATWSEQLGTDDENTLNSLGNLAIAYSDAGKVDLALQLYEESLQRRKVSLGPDHPDTLVSMGSLATGYKHTGRLDQALPLFEETLQLMKEKLGPDDPNTLTVMSNLAVTYLDAQLLEKALPLLKETVDQYRKVFGPEYPGTLTSMGNLANGYSAANQFDLAAPLLEETLRLERARLGSDHPSTIIAINNLAGIYGVLQQYDKSVPLFEEMLRLQEQRLGRQHPATQTFIANLATNYLEVGRKAEAIPLLEEAYQSSKQQHNLCGIGTFLVTAYIDIGRNAEALAIIEELVPEFRQWFPANSPQLAVYLAQTGTALLRLQQFAAAEPILREALAIREQAEPNDWRTFNTQSLLGGALLGQEKYAEAQTLLHLGYEGMKEREAAIPPQGLNRLTEALERLVKLYEDWNTAEPDQGFDAKLKEWQQKLDELKITSEEGNP